MKRANPILLAFIVVLLLGFWLVRRSREPLPDTVGKHVSTNAETVATGVVVTVESSPSPPTDRQTESLLGDKILREYANTNFPPENDLTLMSHLMDNSLLLLKSAANRPLSANEDWADLLRGNNQAHERFLPDQHTALNAQGQLVDRWGTPLFFHALGGGRFELRSAGPDRKLWTADDIHRNADGSFRRGEDLNAPSLLDAATNRPPRLR